ncbi:hypothetical protein D3C83_186250 [compost metagenome]
MTLNRRRHEKRRRLEPPHGPGHDDRVVLGRRLRIEHPHIRENHRYAFGDAIDTAVEDMIDMDIGEECALL